MADDEVAIDDSVPVWSPSDLTEDWLSDVVKASVKGFSTARIGEGQISDAYRVSLQYAPFDQNDPPSTVVLKVASDDEPSRKSSSKLGLYERESRFYSEIAPSIPLDDAPLTHCYYSSFSIADNVVCLILEDAAPAAAGNDLSGATLEQAKLALSELGKLHRSTMDYEELAEQSWLNHSNDIDQQRFQKSFEEFARRYEQRVKPEHLAVARRLAESFDLWRVMEEEEEGSLLGLMHGDYRLDNMLFGNESSEKRLTVVDWQLVQWGHVLNDVSYFLGAALTTENRRLWEDDLLKSYYEGLGPDPPLSMDVLKGGVREHTFYGIITATVSPIIAKRTEHGDNLFLTLFARHCEHALDLDSMSLLPQTAAQRQSQAASSAVRS